MDILAEEWMVLMSSGFIFRAYVVRVIDGDTMLIDPQITPPDQQMRIRLKDVYAPELKAPGGQEAKAALEAFYPPGTKVILSNTHIHWSHDRLEAEVDAMVPRKVVK